MLALGGVVANRSRRHHDHARQAQEVKIVEECGELHAPARELRQRRNQPDQHDHAAAVQEVLPAPGEQHRHRERDEVEARVVGGVPRVQP